MTKEQMWANVNDAASAADLDAVEAVAVTQGYSDAGLLRQTIAERRKRLSERTPTRKG